MSTCSHRVIAVDWSGAMDGFRKKIWLAEARADGLKDLRDGWSREEVGEFLVETSKQDSNLIVGLDFAFSFPSWFVEEVGCATITDLWQYVEVEGAAWLDTKQEQRYFYRKGSWKHEGRTCFRLTEQKLREQKRPPETIFRLVGQRQVGPGSVRGMPILWKLKEAGFNIWPFDPPEPPLVVEIYPALFYKKGVKTSLEKRMEFVKDDPRFTVLQRTQACCSDDAFDAAISALTMYDRRDELLDLPMIDSPQLPRETDGTHRKQVQLEGWIFGA